MGLAVHQIAALVMFPPTIHILPNARDALITCTSTMEIATSLVNSFVMLHLALGLAPMADIAVELPVEMGCLSKNCYLSA